MMITKDEILGFLSHHREILAERYSVRRIGLFGSFRHEAANAQSDIDLLVELDHPTFDHYMDLKFFLEDHFQRSVDLVLVDSVKPRLKPLLSREVIYA